MNLVELLAEPEGQRFNQRCKYGNLVDGHAVYCHNKTWAEAPYKCRRTWYYGEECAARDGVRDEDCPGYEPNPEFHQPGGAS